ncbi:Fe-S cluster assembly sulfur transfer protein SufU [Mycoplasmopsis pulmonis]|uniref:Fe-S cluster assembly sulfur transfer protein SufU n=1 Tax=Mycoplasmopsis pulmonis TaxID=2107 RepID=UPI002ACEABD9|nr:SUF system NifU family Fe-S cluster assembly protein [Mycoplasmopsis pulmonis]MDZ7293141.1 SUF system NifU family Fe-S cluster assembly protein [Mycoplasmopsis pulmonis]
MTKLNENEKRKLIMKHYEFPINLDKNLDEKTANQIYSSSCADSISIKLEIDKNIVKNISFNGSGCAIFISSTDLLLEQIKNKNIDEVLDIIGNYKNMINAKENVKDDKLGNLVIFENVKKHLNRAKCASLTADFIEEKLKKHSS